MKQLKYFQIFIDKIPTPHHLLYEIRVLVLCASAVLPCLCRSGKGNISEITCGTDVSWLEHSLLCEYGSKEIRRRGDTGKYARLVQASFVHILIAFKLHLNAVSMSTILCFSYNYCKNRFIFWV